MTISHSWSVTLKQNKSTPFPHIYKYPQNQSPTPYNGHTPIYQWSTSIDIRSFKFLKALDCHRSAIWSWTVGCHSGIWHIDFSRNHKLNPLLPVCHLICRHCTQILYGTDTQQYLWPYDFHKINVTKSIIVFLSHQFNHSHITPYH